MFKGYFIGIFAISFMDLIMLTSQQATQNANAAQEGGFDLKKFIVTNFGDTNKYFFELMLVILLVIYVINYFLGKRLNEKYALLWVQENRAFFDTEFAHVGVSNQESGGAVLDAESANAFKFYASGRQNCAYALTTIEFKKRQDLLSMLIFNLIWPERDRIRIEVPIEIANPLPFVFAVVRRKEAKYVQANYPDIKNFCRKIPNSELEKQYVVLGENEETVDHILSNAVVSTLRKHDAAIEMISFTDLKKPYNQVLRADLVVPSSYLRNPKEFQPIFKMVLYLVDQVAHYRMSSAVRTKAEKERLAYENLKAKESQKEKSEEIKQKLLEKKKAEGSKVRDEKKEEAKMKKKMQRKFVKMI